jgi:hypothetical protein
VDGIILFDGFAFCTSSYDKTFIDRLLYREVNTTSDTNKLQEDLDMLQKWESKWQMAFNADKCFVIRAGTKRKTIKQDYTIKPSVMLALLVMLLMCAFQVRSLLMVTSNM